ncbi:hypothetical protein MNBD_GAMMA13-1310 [hydrothermal vent metagenome]|uniref:Uncharacterized protein n=1 Tax=hydrothermal vent metagenome TaxID=652676 RepID=A0A3B0YUC1_9ZZZZ
MVVTRINDMPVYAAQTEQMDASLYNLWRRARLHLNMPLRVELPGLKQMVLIIENDSWVVVDQCQYDLPVLAWVGFQDTGRTSLHTPVTCTLNYYHYLADHLREKVLTCMHEALQALLSDTIR